MFGLEKKVEGKQSGGKNVKGIKVKRWIESEIIFRLFGRRESEYPLIKMICDK